MPRSPVKRKRRTDAVLRALVRPPHARQSASEYIRHALQTLSNLNELGGLEISDRREIRSAMQRLWLALREIEQNNA
jgi:hypothetical protein